MRDAETGSPDESSPPPDAAEPAASGRFALLHDPWFRFAAVFGVLAVSCEILYYAFLVDSHPLRHYLAGLAWVAVQILTVLGFDAHVNHTLISSDTFAVQIAHGCDAIQISALYSSAVLAFPAPWRRRLRGLVVGITWLQFLNQVRIVSLVLIGRFYESIFERSHYTLWPSFLIVITVVSWIVWVRWATRDVATVEPSGA